MSGAEKVQRVYYVEGEKVHPPDAGGKGEWLPRTRVRMLKDGIADCLAFCPGSERVLKTYLQQAWVEAVRMERLLPVPPEEPALFALGEDGCS
jgi:hypothetical protein